MTHILESILGLAKALGVEPDEAQLSAIQHKLEVDALDVEGAAPDWLIAFIDSLAQQVHTPDWVPFEVKGLEASDSFDFIRGLGSILPLTVVDDEERWTVRADAIGHEAVLSFEGYLYLTRPIGAPEPGEIGESE